MKAVSVLQSCLGEVGDLDTPLINWPSALAVDEGSVDHGRPHTRVSRRHTADEVVHGTLGRSSKNVVNFLNSVQIVIYRCTRLAEVIRLHVRAGQETGAGDLDPCWEFVRLKPHLKDFFLMERSHTWIFTLALRQSFSDSLSTGHVTGACQICYSYPLLTRFSKQLWCLVWSSIHTKHYISFGSRLLDLCAGVQVSNERSHRWKLSCNDSRLALVSY